MEYQMNYMRPPGQQEMSTEQEKEGEKDVLPYNTVDLEPQIFVPLRKRIKEGKFYHGEKPRLHSDHRRTGYFDVFPTTFISDINIVKIPTLDTVVAWHRHKYQYDMWFCVQGGLQVGLWEGDALENVQWAFLSPEIGTTLWIPPGVWHGYRSLQPNTILIYCLTNKYDGSDEERLSLEESGIDFLNPE